jgi:hypothetical protein
MLDTHDPKSYWGDALLTATYLINRMPSPVSDFKSPLEVLSLPFSTSKGVSLKVFCCVCFAHIHGLARSKLDPRALKCVFVGYFPTQKGYKCYHSHQENNFSLWMPLSLNHNHTSLHLKLLFRGRVRLKRIF